MLKTSFAAGRSLAVSLTQSSLQSSYAKSEKFESRLFDERDVRSFCQIGGLPARLGEVLKKTGDNPKAIADDDRFSPNTQFQCPQSRAATPQPVII